MFIHVSVHDESNNRMAVKINRVSSDVLMRSYKLQFKPQYPILYCHMSIQNNNVISWWVLGNVIYSIVSVVIFVHIYLYSYIPSFRVQSVFIFIVSSVIYIGTSNRTSNPRSLVSV